MYVPFVWMNMRMETSSESFHVLMVSSCVLGLTFVLKQLSKTPCLNPTVNLFIDFVKFIFANTQECMSKLGKEQTFFVFLNAEKAHIPTFVFLFGCTHERTSGFNTP